MADELSCFDLPSGQQPEWVRKVRCFARAPMPLLLRGESGVGKTMLAGAVHRLSGRGGRYEVLPLHAGSTDLVRDELLGHEDGAYTGARGKRRGLLQEVNDGTLLIDEIGDASPEIQALLLPILDSTPVGVRKVGGDRSFVPPTRFVLATCIDLRARAQDGRFRRDLLHRISGLTVHVPPLRERMHELPLHANAVLRRLDQEYPSLSGEPYSLTEESWHRMHAYDWPGNLRELTYSLQAAVYLGNGCAVVEMLELSPTEDDAGDDRGDQQRARLELLLRRHRGNASQVAVALGVSRTTLYALCERFGMDLEVFRMRRA